MYFNLYQMQRKTAYELVVHVNLITYNRAPNNIVGYGKFTN